VDIWTTCCTGGGSGKVEDFDTIYEIESFQLFRKKNEVTEIRGVFLKTVTSIIKICSFFSCFPFAAKRL